MKKLLLVAGGIILVLVIIGIIAGGANNQPTKVGDSSTTSQSENKTSGQTQEFDVKEEVKLGEREFVVNSVRKTKSLGQYQEAKSDKEFVVVNVTITNKGSGEVSYNPFDFKIQNSEGAQESQTFASLDDQLNAGTLVSGGKVTGSIPFEVKSNDPGLKLIFQPSFWSDSRIVVKL